MQVFHFFDVHLRQDKVFNLLQLTFHGFAIDRNEHFLKGLADPDIYFFPDRQYKRGDFLCHFHSLFQFKINPGFIGYRKISMVYGAERLFTGDGIQVPVNGVSEEWRNWRSQFRNSDQTIIECLICTDFIRSIFTLPEPPSGKSYVPVAEQLVNKFINRPSSQGWLIVFHVLVDMLDKTLQA